MDKVRNFFSKGSILNKADNKTQLFKLMLRVWESNSSTANVHGRNVIVVVKGSKYKVMSAGSTYMSTKRR